MVLIARPINWPAGSRSAERSDFEVFEDAVAIGRICQTPDPDNPVWFWSLYGRVAEGDPPNGLADSLDEAQARFKASWDNLRNRQGSI